MRAHEAYAETFETWQRMLPPLIDPTVTDPWAATRAAMGVQRAALATWLESCEQAQALAELAFGWQAQAMERVAAELGGER